MQGAVLSRHKWMIWALCLLRDWQLSSQKGILNSTFNSSLLLFSPLRVLPPLEWNSSVCSMTSKVNELFLSTNPMSHCPLDKNGSNSHLTSWGQSKGFPSHPYLLAVDFSFFTSPRCTTTPPPNTGHCVQQNNAGLQAGYTETFHNQQLIIAYQLHSFWKSFLCPCHEGQWETWLAMSPFFQLSPPIILPRNLTKILVLLIRAIQVCPSKPIKTLSRTKGLCYWAKEQQRPQVPDPRTPSKHNSRPHTVFLLRLLVGSFMAALLLPTPWAGDAQGSVFALCYCLL